MILSWAFAFPLIKIGLEYLSPVNLTIMRFTVVCISFLFVWGLQSQKFTKIIKKDIPALFLLGFCGVIVYHLCLNYGEQFISPGAASLIIATIPLFIIVLATFFLSETITLKRMVGVSLALLGVIIISLWGKKDFTIEIEYVLGAFAVLIAALVGALYTVAGKRLLHRYSALSLTAYAMLLGSIGLLPFINYSLVDEITHMPFLGWIAIVFLGVCSTVIGYMLWYYGLESKDASEMSVYLYCIPIVTILIDFFVFNEEITLLFLLGGSLIFLGLILANSKNR
jgi:drug/metabolite transporter (DMT)-like permease